MQKHQMIAQDSFLEVLSASGRSPEISPADDVYGWLIGAWDLDIVINDGSGHKHQSQGEAHFAWVLEGRAVQDVWINPRREDRASYTGLAAANMYGTTLRVYDPSWKAWKVTWTNPVTGAKDELIGRWHGDDIVQEGTNAAGGTIRWSFLNIKSESFRWLGELQLADGSWFVQADRQARRRR